MALEIEAKLKVDSLDPVRARLQAQGGVFRGAALETDYIFDKADRSLQAADQALRVRTLHTLQGEPRPTTLTYKGRRHDGQFKTREEYEVAIDDAEALRRILAELDFVEVIRFQKRRESWALGDCRIELDELPYLGCYVEIEGPSEAAVRDVQERIGLAELCPVRSTYISLLMQYCRAHGLPDDQVFFEPVGT